MTLIIFLVVLGLALVIAEVMFPSFGVLGLLATTSFVVAIIKAFEQGNTEGKAVVVGSAIAIPVAIGIGFKLLKHSPVGKKLLQEGPRHEDVAGSAADSSLADLLGKTGVAETDLRPSGVVLVGDRRIDAVSDGSFLDRGTAVELVQIEGNRVVVAPLEGPNDDTSAD